MPDDVDYHCRRRGRRVSSSHSNPSLTQHSSTPSNNPTCSSGSVSIRQKRKYRHVARTKSPNLPSDRTQRWNGWLISKTDEGLKSLKCCKKNCFTLTDVSFLREKVAALLCSSRTTRRIALMDMLTSSGKFYFDGHPVCSVFLLKSFRFSTELQAEVREHSRRIDGMTTFPGSDPNILSPNSQSSASSLTDQAFGADSIINFIERLASQTASHMPDRDEMHLPFINKVHVYEKFIEEFKILYPVRTTPSSSYFYSVWKANCSHIKVRKASRFTKCGTCERLRSALQQAVSRRLSTHDLLVEKAEHLSFVNRERREYKRKSELAALYPTEYLSVVIDGADQSAFALPHFVHKVKDSRGHGIRVHLIGLLQHEKENRLHLFTMTDEHETGSNHMIEACHRFINDKARDGKLPSTFFVQLDNSRRENKNKYSLSYFESLVRWGVFKVVEISFLPIGHTHCDVDQCFSTTSHRLRHNDAVTMSNLHEQLSKCFNRHTVVSAMKECVNFSGLCDKLECVNTLTNITQYRFFRFSRTDGASTSNGCHSNCFVKHSAQDDWTPLEVADPRKISNLLRFTPDLTETPPEKVTAPDDMADITARIESENGRINSDQKLRELLATRDEIYQSRNISFHWDKRDDVEFCNSSASRVFGMDGDVDLEHPVEEDPGIHGKCSYDTGSFVIVLGNALEGQNEFWVGEIIDVTRTGTGIVRSLTVKWYEHYGPGDLYSAKYRPISTSSNSNRSGFWTDRISTASVVILFNSLNRTKRLPVQVVTHMKEVHAQKNKN